MIKEDIEYFYNLTKELDNLNKLYKLLHTSNDILIGNEFAGYIPLTDKVYGHIGNIILNRINHIKTCLETSTIETDIPAAFNKLPICIENYYNTYYVKLHRSEDKWHIDIATKTNCILNEFNDYSFDTVVNQAYAYCKSLENKQDYKLYYSKVKK